MKAFACAPLSSSEKFNLDFRVLVHPERWDAEHRHVISRRVQMVETADTLSPTGIPSFGLPYETGTNSCRVYVGINV